MLLTYVIIISVIFSHLHTFAFGISEISLRHSHTRTWVPYGDTVTSVVTVSYIRQISQTSEPAGLKTKTDFILWDTAKW